MRLSWDYGYEDYADLEHFLPRLDELKAFVGDTPPEIACGLSDEAILDFMEANEELMRYYASSNDLKNLEPCMRLQEAMLHECEFRGITFIGFQYLKMEFVRLNALLYRSVNQNRQAVEYFREFCAVSRECFDALKHAESLTNDQILFVGWSCTEGIFEAAQAYDLLMQGMDSTALLYDIMRMLEWLESYMSSYSGILDKAANLYCSIAGVFYQQNDPKSGSLCFENCIRIYEDLDSDFGSDFYRARAIWARGLHGLQEFLIVGNPKPMLTCKAESEKYLSTRSPIDRDRGIILGAEGLVVIQQSASFQQNGRLSEAIQLGVTGCDHLRKALKLLETEIDQKEGYIRDVLVTIASRVFATYVGALDMVGVQYYSGDNAARAKECFNEALTLIADTSRYTVSEAAVIGMRAECSLYLGLIASDDGMFNEMEFYGKQAAEQAVYAAKNYNNSAMWAIHLVACAVLSEVYLSLKNKPLAKSYAEQGLESCNLLQRIAPDTPQLQMRPVLEKNLKKASRRFF